jgi:threonine dehydrogenase-like Zn-dependent dehydrogenase
MGATEVLPPSQRSISQFLERNGSAAYIFECVGNDKTFKLALDLIKRGGTVVLEGIYRGTISFPLMLLNSKEVHIQGVLGHDREDILDAIALVEKKKVDPSKLISEIVPLKDIQIAFEKFLEPEERNFLKIIVKIS